jgi:hypothetical protein
VAAAPAAFPSPVEGSLGAMLGARTGGRQSNVLKPGEANAGRAPPREFRYSQGGRAASSRPAGFVDQVALAEGQDACSICLDAVATHRTEPCACRAVYCLRCIEDWVRRSAAQKKNDGRAQCITCELGVDKIVRVDEGEGPSTG